MHFSLSPMKHRKANKSKSSALDSSDTQKATKLKRTQERKNKRLKMAMGA